MNDNDIKILENRVRDLENELNEITIDYLQTKATTQAKPLMRFGVYSAVVISTFDIWKQNRVQFYTPILDDGTTQVDALPWASPISSFGGFDDSGVSWVPPPGSKVFIIFENGLNGSAFYIGTSWTRTRGLMTLAYLCQNLNIYIKEKILETDICVDQMMVHKFFLRGIQKVITDLILTLCQMLIKIQMQF